MFITYLCYKKNKIKIFFTFVLKKKKNEKGEPHTIICCSGRLLKELVPSCLWERSGGHWWDGNGLFTLHFFTAGLIHYVQLSSKLFTPTYGQGNQRREFKTGTMVSNNGPRL